MTTKQSYLMWIGSESYPTIEDWAAEAEAMGISKRLPNASVGAKMAEPGTVIFVAHDEGEADECRACLGTVECPECRKLIQEKTAIDAELKRLGEHADRVPLTGMQIRRLTARRKRALAIAAELGGCSACFGKGSYSGGTGGHVKLADGTAMDYRAFNYWLHQPKKFDAKTAVEREMCEACGGTGKTPDAKLFGLFVPNDVEYILSGDESEETLAKLEGFKKVTRTTLMAEAPRKCGRRHSGGTYVVTTVEGDPMAAKRALKELVAKGLVKPEGAEIKGSFIRFLTPISINAKRFRGIKTWAPTSDAIKAATADIMEALA